VRASNHATVLVSDRNLIVPTAQVAAQLSRAGRDLTNVVIVTGGLAPTEFDALQEAMAAHQVSVLDSTKEITALLNEFDFGGDNHYTPTSLARLLLDDILPAQYEEILYIDGDTYVAGDLTDLFQLRVPAGKIAAGLDSLFLHIDGTSEFAGKLRNYRRKHSTLGPENYFNAGILAAQRATWKTVGPAALRFYRDHYEDCIFHDQSALNVICENAVHWISPAYNFATDFRLMGFQLHLKPKLFHFSGASKPWNSRFNPWPLHVPGDYKKFLATHPGLTPLVTRQDAEQAKKIRNRLIAHVIRDSPGLKNPARFLQKHAYFRNYMRSHQFEIV
jgi:lipopolysaccharide biosynthesis glycosyltransferase